MNKEQLQTACDLLGGQAATSRLLNLKSPRYLRKVINEDAPIPEGWRVELTEIMAQRIQNLNRAVRSI